MFHHGSRPSNSKMHDGCFLLFPFVSRPLLPEPLKTLLLMFPWAKATWPSPALSSSASVSSPEQLRAGWLARPAKLPGNWVQRREVRDLVPAQTYHHLSPDFTSLICYFLICKMTGLGLKISKPLPSSIVLGEIQQAQAGQRTSHAIISPFRKGEGRAYLSPYMKHGALSLENWLYVRYCNNCFMYI